MSYPFDGVRKRYKFRVTSDLPEPVYNALTREVGELNMERAEIVRIAVIEHLRQAGYLKPSA